MKKNSIKISLFLGLVGVLTLTSCNKDQKTIESIESSMTGGSWRVTKFIDSGTDETNNFTGYNFEFNESDALSATNGTTTFLGTWSITDSNSDDNNEDDLHFNIGFALTNDFEDLTDDWDFVSHSSTKIELIDVSGGSGGTDYLTFEKN